MVQFLKGSDGFPSPTHYIGAETDIITYNVIKKSNDSSSVSQLKEITSLIMQQRSIKLEYEIEKIRNAAELWRNYRSSRPSIIGNLLIANQIVIL